MAAAVSCCSPDRGVLSTAASTSGIEIGCSMKQGGMRKGEAEGLRF